MVVKTNEYAWLLRTSIIAGLLSALPASTVRAQLQFSSPTNYPVGSSPGQVVTGDFNGDGKQDMAVLNTGDQTVSILLGNGDGTFQLAKSQSTGSTATGLAAGDFNGDGKLDLAIANGSANTVSVMLGNGDGTFKAPVQYNIGSSADFVALGDFNNDNKLDLLVSTAGHSPSTSSTPSPGELNVLLGKGDGTFQAPTVTHLDSFGDTTADAAISDFNSDGKLDVAIGNLVNLTCNIGGANCEGGNVLVFLGNGDGSFQAPAESSVDFYPGYFATGDFDGNGKVDLAVIGAQALRSQPEFPFIQRRVIETLSGNGDGTFAAPSSVASLNSSVFECHGAAYATNLAVADFNGDGKADLIAPIVDFLSCGGSPSPAVWVFLGNGDNSFQAPQKISLATLPSWLTLGDFSGITLADFAVSNSSANDVSVFLNGTPGVILSVTLAGKGGGAVMSQSDILNCTSSCSGQFMPGTLVTLTAAPNATSDFTGWSGACSGTSSCSITMTSNEAVTATFGALPPPDFSITPASASLTGQRGGQVTDVITLTPLNGEAFASAIQLACTVTGSTPLASCALSAASITPGANPASSTLTITVPAQSARLIQNGDGQLTGPLYAVFLLVPGFTLIGLGLARGKSKERRRRLWLMCSLFIACVALQIGCGGGSNAPPPMPLNYTVTVTAVSGAIQHTTQVTVTVP